MYKHPFMSFDQYLQINVKCTNCSMMRDASFSIFIFNSDNYFCSVIFLMNFLCAVDKAF